MANCQSRVKMKDRLLLIFIYALPKRTVSRLVGRFARSRLSRRVIPLYIRRFDIDLSQVEKPVQEYNTLLDFFVRGLKPGARPIDPDEQSVVSPVDGTVYQEGRIHKGTLLQAKGVTYSLEGLLGGNKEAAKCFEGGQFVTIYLSPRDYHRIHAPIKGRVFGFSYIPGALYPVNKLGLNYVRGLFAKNERLITYLESAAGKIAVVKVGATNVGSIKVTYDSNICTNRVRPSLEHREYQEVPELNKGEELGRFEFGSTVILLFESNMVRWCTDMEPGSFLKMGEPIAKIIGNKKSEG